MARPKPNIEQAQPQDWRRCRALRLQALAQDPDAFGSTLEEEEPQPEAFWIQRMHKPIATLIATLAEQDVGLAVVAAAWDNPNDAGIYSVWVAPQARGHGVGQALIQEAIAVATQRGFHRLVLEVGDHNQHAVALYERMGFETTGRSTTLPAPRDHIREHERAYPLR